MNDVEILKLNNIKSPIQSHFHEFYVFGFIEKGCRKMLCNSVEYFLCPGDMLIFNPYDVHSCKNLGDVPMQYFSMNIKEDVIKDFFCGKLPVFQNVIKASTSFSSDTLRDKKRCAEILKKLPHCFQGRDKTSASKIQEVCKIIEQNLSHKITLEFLCSVSGLSKSSLLRAFVREKGISPYKYVEALRINKAKTLLLKGVSPVETALALGFSSQSHFINSFKSLTGLSPGAFRKEVKCF